MTTESSVRTVMALEATFPSALLVVTPPVAALWYRGRLPDSGCRGLAIVGGRAATPRGCRLAADLAGAAVERGYTVVSGGALGIDAAAHRGALDAGGTTYAVLGCGVDVVYPDRHTALFDDIAASGALISEFSPGTPPKGWHFPVRNRLVVALSEVVVVVEARRRSGALITAARAGEMGRRLFVVPGSEGTDELLAKGAATGVTGVSDLVRALAGERITRRPPEAYAALVGVLSEGQAQPIDISRRLGMPLPEALALAAQAELEGWVRRFPGGGIGLLSPALERDPRAS